MLTESAFNVVVYKEPGPTPAEIMGNAKRQLKIHSRCDKDGGLGYLTYHHCCFEIIYNGIEQGDTLPTAYASLYHLGPVAQQFINCPEDFIYEWMGIEDKRHGRILLLQVIPLPHTIAAFYARLN